MPGKITKIIHAIKFYAASMPEKWPFLPKITHNKVVNLLQIHFTYV
ncbi:Hypothetical protein F387_01782 [Wohlfahrtiimonas chitiniclastica SH04]|uniref:Uncharacterized protein n=1 Tax=Wohlfahrtiimonas chitiniclastica SH04 TaxID=1261130 RepID=L8XTY7_9GAMM|nr:Hypothetical protein F387_01782 [Wohlfahrtiimonas chitiniclastica SH04]